MWCNLIVFELHSYLNTPSSPATTAIMHVSAVEQFVFIIHITSVIIFLIQHQQQRWLYILIVCFTPTLSLCLVLRSAWIWGNFALFIQAKFELCITLLVSIAYYSYHYLSFTICLCMRTIKLVFNSYFYFRAKAAFVHEKDFCIHNVDWMPVLACDYSLVFK